MKVIITGISGFVGQNLSDCLIRKNIEVVGLSLRIPGWEDRFSQHADAVIHLAGKAHDTASTAVEEEYYKVNTDLTRILFEAFLNSDVRDFFYFSSVKAAADEVEGVLNEDHPPHPATPYGKSKLLAEQYLLSKQLPEGKRLFIIRPCMIHGPGNKGNLNLLYKTVKKGIPWPLAAFGNMRSYLSIDNLNFLIHQMLTTNLPSGIYNFADDETLSTNEVVRLMAHAAGKRAVFWNLPQGFVRSLGRIGDTLNLPFNSERLLKLTETYTVSNEKIKKALGIIQLPVSASEGLEKTFKNFNNTL
ncbi:NAD-dependent epimerase/dehydratase family protein [Chryseobacterium sp.]|uniref:NAD-dependent epimerase/dehydratase family protein n=1 Tax=Chryseobacterium sp. TaxID=1871047 RepID=UPI0011CA589E|nr:NAD-dependent epimerase/dehydratase family protein [Chryseobacterium sp.]TXF77561.1 NAD-dependent epimerase/dehydratase family protein [Chryseobacterium sp.]